MKNSFFVLLFLATLLVFGGLWYVKRQHIVQLGFQMASLEAKINEQSRQLEDRKRMSDWLVRQRRDLQLQLAKLYAQNDILSQNTNSPVTAAAAATGVNPDGASPGDSVEKGNVLSLVLQNPEVKKMMLQQERMAMDKAYHKLFKDLKFTPNESETFLSLLQERSAKEMETAAAYFGKDPQTADEVFSKGMVDHEDYERKIKDLLSEDRYAKYVDYNETVGERMMLNQFATMTAVTEDQTSRLIEVMKEEKRRVKTESDELLNSIRNFQAFPNDEDINRLVQHQETMHARVLEGAKAILAPEQLQAFTKHLANQVAMGRTELKATRSMIGGRQETSGGIPPK